MLIFRPLSHLNTLALNIFIKMRFQQNVLSPQSPSPPLLHTYAVDPHSLASGKILQSHLGKEIDVAVLLTSMSYTQHQSLDSRNILLHFVRPKHLSVLLQSQKINRKFWVCSNMEKKKSISNPSQQNDHRAAGFAWDYIILAKSGGQCS